MVFAQETDWNAHHDSNSFHCLQRFGWLACPPPLHLDHLVDIGGQDGTFCIRDGKVLEPFCKGPNSQSAREPLVGRGGNRKKAARIKGRWAWSVGTLQESPGDWGGRGTSTGLVGSWWIWGFWILPPELLAELCQLIAELCDLMLRFRICGPGRKPALNGFSDLLSCIFGIGGFVQYFPISCPVIGDPVQVDASASELREQLRRKHHRCNVPRWDQVYNSRP